ncbi:MAG: hypothetical protein V1494_01475 [Candidatus Diapherotrites archaeon]
MALKFEGNKAIIKEDLNIRVFNVVLFVVSTFILLFFAGYNRFQEGILMQWHEIFFWILVIFLLFSVTVLAHFLEITIFFDYSMRQWVIRRPRMQLIFFGYAEKIVKSQLKEIKAEKLFGRFHPIFVFADETEVNPTPHIYIGMLEEFYYLSISENEFRELGKMFNVPVIL